MRGASFQGYGGVKWLRGKREIFFQRTLLRCILDSTREPKDGNSGEFNLGHVRRECMLSERILRFALLAFMPVLSLTAQTGSGTIQGVVRDASAGVIAGANVTILHTATMGKYSTTTNEVGFFHFPPTQFGSYKMTVGAAGMQTWESEFLLQVGQTVDIT